jgi:hypothetical protein
MKAQTVAYCPGGPGMPRAPPAPPVRLLRIFAPRWWRAKAPSGRTQHPIMIPSAIDFHSTDSGRLISVGESSDGNRGFPALSGAGGNVHNLQGNEEG